MEPERAGDGVAQNTQCMINIACRLVQPGDHALSAWKAGMRGCNLKQSYAKCFFMYLYTLKIDLLLC